MHTRDDHNPPAALPEGRQPAGDRGQHVVTEQPLLQIEAERDRLVLEAEAARAEAAARAAELEAIFDGMADGVIVCDSTGRMLRMNVAYRRLLGLSSGFDEVVRLPEGRGQLFKPRDSEGRPLSAEQRPMARILRGEVLSDANASDLLVHSADGREVVLNASGTPLRDAQGRIIGGVAIFRDVTQRRKLESEVRARAGQLEAILEAMADAVFVFDRAGGVVETNSAGREMFGLQLPVDFYRAPLAERGMRTTVRDGQEQPMSVVEWPMSRVLQGEVLKGASAVDLQVDTADRRRLELQVSGAPLRDQAGEPTGAVCVVRDVTERRQLERRTQQALTSLLAMAESLVLVSDPDFEAHAAATDSSPGLSPAGGMVAQRLLELTMSVLGCARGGFLAVDPAQNTLQSVAFAGQSTSEQRALWRTVTQQARLGQRLTAEQVAALHAGEPLIIDFRQPAFRDLPNPAGTTTCIMVPVRLADELIGLLALDHGGAPHEYTTGELALARAVARMGALVIERERLLRERAQAEARELALRETNRRMNEFLGIAGHEFRTPLTTISANAQLVERRLQRAGAAIGDVAGDPPGVEPGHARTDPPIQVQIGAAREVLGRIYQQIRRLDRLVGDLLDVSRIQADRLELRFAPCDLTAVVREMVEEQRQLHPGRTIELSPVPDESLLVYADVDRIAQVVTNYLTNALKYSRADCTVHVGLEVVGVWPGGSNPALRGPGPARDRGRPDVPNPAPSATGCALVWVRDHGPGLYPAQQEHIWERFYRAEGVEVQSGSGVGLGLGLYISKTIVDRHGGRVGVDSTPGEGSAFWFTLPLPQS